MRFGQWRSLNGDNYYLTMEDIVAAEKKLRIEHILESGMPMSLFKKEEFNDLISPEVEETGEEDEMEIEGEGDQIVDEFVEILSTGNENCALTDSALHVAGAASAKVAKKTKCVSCKELFVVPNSKGTHFDSIFLNNLQRGGLIRPQKMVEEYLEVMTLIFSSILKSDQEFKNFFALPNQVNFLAQQTLARFSLETIPCENCKIDPQGLIKSLLKYLSTTVLSGYVRCMNKNSVKRSKRKENIFVNSNGNQSIDVGDFLETVQNQILPVVPNPDTPSVVPNQIQTCYASSANACENFIFPARVVHHPSVQEFPSSTTPLCPNASAPDAPPSTSEPHSAPAPILPPPTLLAPIISPTFLHSSCTTAPSSSNFTLSVPAVAPFVSETASPLNLEPLSYASSPHPIPIGSTTITHVFTPHTNDTNFDEAINELKKCKEALNNLPRLPSPISSPDASPPGSPAPSPLKSNLTEKISNFQLNSVNSERKKDLEALNQVTQMAKSLIHAPVPVIPETLQIKHEDVPNFKRFYEEHYEERCRYLLEERERNTKLKSTYFLSCQCILENISILNRICEMLGSIFHPDDQFQYVAALNSFTDLIAPDFALRFFKHKFNFTLEEAKAQLEWQNYEESQAVWKQAFGSESESDSE